MSNETKTCSDELLADAEMRARLRDIDGEVSLDLRDVTEPAKVRRLMRVYLRHLGYEEVVP